MERRQRATFCLREPQMESDDKAATETGQREKGERKQENSKSRRNIDTQSVRKALKCLYRLGVEFCQRSSRQSESEGQNGLGNAEAQYSEHNAKWTRLFRSVKLPENWQLVSF